MTNSATSDIIWERASCDHYCAFIDDIIVGEIIRTPGPYGGWWAARIGSARMMETVRTTQNEATARYEVVRRSVRRGA